MPGVPPNPFHQQELEYCTLIAEVGAANRDNPVWLASTVGSKNFGVSPLWQRLQEYVRTGVCFTPGPARPWWTLRHAASQVYRLLLLAPLALRWRWRGRSGLAGIEHLIVSHLFTSSFGPADNDYRDPYFEPLLAQLLAHGQRVAVVGHIYHGEHEVRAQLLARNLTSPPVLPLALFQSPLDVVRALFRSWRQPVVLPRELVWRGRNIAPVLAAQLREERRDGSLFCALLQYYALRRLLQRCPARRLYWPWEHHSWERLLLLARRQLGHPARAIAFQHSTVPPFLLNHFPGAAELAYADYPARIVCTGPEARAILAAFGHFPPECLTTGCALRHGYLWAADTVLRPRPPAVRTIGVVLSIGGRDHGEELLAWAAQAVAGTDLRVLVRCHPGMPATILFKGRPLPAPLALAPAGSLTDFLSSVDCVLYTISTVGFEAVALGVPVIAVGAADEQTTDPLFACPALHWRAESAAALRATLTSLATVTDNEFARQQQVARAYVRGYLAPVTAAGLESFLSA